MSNRGIIYPGQIPLETDLLYAQQQAMVGLAKLSAATLGTNTIANGLAVTQTTVPSMAVAVAPGEIYQLTNLEGTAYSSLPADTTDQIVKQGISLAVQTLSVSAPGTAGQSINYLIEATFSEVDGTPVTLPYYNASNPAVAYSGPANSGAAQNTRRMGTVALLAKAGTAATTGTQTTPAPDSGYIGLYVVTVANGASTVVNANISQYAGASLLPANLLSLIQQGQASYATDTGAANACAVAYSPAIPALVDGMSLRFKVKAPNTGVTTLNVNGLGAQPIVGAGYLSLQGGELIANGICTVVWNASISGWVLIGCTGGALPVVAGSSSNQAVNFGQSFGNGQTWQNVAASRASGTVYTNSTGRAIFVSAVNSSVAGGGLTAVVNGVTVANPVNATEAVRLLCAFVVPNGGTYSITLAGGASFTIWAELR